MTKYYVYAGYYEIYVTNRPLRRPLMLQGWHKSLEKALEHAESFDVSVLYDRSILEDCCNHYGAFSDEFEEYTFDGAEYSIENGFTSHTEDCFRVCGDKVPGGQDRTDIFEWLRCKTGLSLRKLIRLHGDKTYDELRPVIAAACA